MTIKPIPPSCGILILNYHQPEATRDCVRSFLEKEGPETTILWIENDASRTGDSARTTLDASGLPWVELSLDDSVLPAPGQVGLLRVPTNLGYAGGNNVGLRRLHAAGVPWSWVVNNDTLLTKGGSSVLIEAAQKRPDVGLWGTTIRSADDRLYSGALLDLDVFATEPILDSSLLETNPLAYVSGCSLFFQTEFGASLGFLPEDYFLYYEDPAFTQEARRKGLTASACLGVEIFHLESLSTGHRSPLMEYYSRRNRWAFIQHYFPEYLEPQRRKAWYRFQSLLFRGAFKRMLVEWRAMQDWKAGRMGRTVRTF